MNIAISFKIVRKLCIMVNSKCIVFALSLVYLIFVSSMKSNNAKLTKQTCLNRKEPCLSNCLSFTICGGVLLHTDMLQTNIPRMVLSFFAS